MKAGDSPLQGPVPTADTTGRPAAEFRHGPSLRDRLLSRRQFLGSSAKNAAGVAAGMASVAQLADVVAGETTSRPASERIRLGVVGLRNRGKELAVGFARLGAEIAALCDVDSTLLPSVLRELEPLQPQRPRTETDVRRLLDDAKLDALVVATPDHWHAEMLVRACAAEKDVYLEVPACLHLADGARMLAAVRSTGRIVQCGIQERSGAHFRAAVELVRQGRIGKVALARAWAVNSRKPIGKKPPAPVPDGVDYALWLGPAPARPFQPNRFHYNWRWFLDYGMGELGHWGVHLLDVARWGLGVEWPCEVQAAGGRFHFHDDRETPDTLSVQFVFPQATVLWEHRQWTNHGLEGRSAAVAFYGDQGTLIVDRGGYKVYGQRDGQSAGASELDAAHLADFLHAVRTRLPPACPLDVGIVSTGLCQLGHLAWLRGRPLHFDAATGSIGDVSAPGGSPV